MNAIWLNRFGILMGFLAGFMIAPELIGIQRLRKAELRLEEMLLERGKSLEGGVTRLQELVKESSDRIGCLAALVIGVLATVSATVYSIWNGYYYIATLLILPLLALFFVLLWILQVAGAIKVLTEGKGPLTLRGPPMTEEEKAWLEVSLLDPFLVIFNASLELLTVIWTFLLLRVLAIAARTVSLTASRLEGEDRLRSILVWWGVIFYVLGTLLQLLATF